MSPPRATWLAGPAPLPRCGLGVSERVSGAKGRRELFCYIFFNVLRVRFYLEGILPSHALDVSFNGLFCVVARCWRAHLLQWKGLFQHKLSSRECGLLYANTTHQFLAQNRAAPLVPHRDSPQPHPPPQRLSAGPAALLHEVWSLIEEDLPRCSHALPRKMVEMATHR